MKPIQQPQMMKVNSSTLAVTTQADPVTINYDRATVEATVANLQNAQALFDAQMSDSIAFWQNIIDQMDAQGIVADPSQIGPSPSPAQVVITP